MGVSIGHVCGRGRGASGQVVTLHCDQPDCRATVLSWSREEYDAQLAAGWHVTTDTAGDRTVGCPDHSGKAPTVPVQTELPV